MRKSDCISTSRCAIIIQARMCSQRFPGKMLYNILDNMPLVRFVYERCRQSLVRKVLVATSEDKSDDVLYEYCINNKMPVIRGSLTDVLGRYIKAADFLNAEYLARIGGDTPFVDISLVVSFLNTLISEKLDYVSAKRETCASGFYSETVTLKALKRAARSTRDKEDLEHVTRFIINNKERFLTKFTNAELNPEFVRETRLTIDYPRDMETAGAIIDELRDRLSFTSKEVLDVVRKKGLRKCAESQVIK
ncbi:MAG: hypothetical protein A2Z72_08390 [Omnitrophica bacterium RBG_13_46_9]|nr:MAG: hypothetical protein A2Z72_08390 [Omnitrophica bacterium RBG_13_46_9]